MVAIDLLPNFDISIKVDGQPFKEYENHDEAEQARNVTSYIEAVSGRLFEIHMVAQNNFRCQGDCLSFTIHVDGSPTSLHNLILKKSALENGKYTRISQGVPQGDHKVKREAGNTADLGSIVIRVTHTVVVGPIASHDVPITTLPGAGNLTEKMLKGRSVSHSVGYMLVIPCELTPPPLEERDFEDINHDDFRELQRRLRELKEKAGDVKVKRETKRELTGDNPRSRKIARPGRASTVLEFDEEDSVRESSTATSAAAPELIELD
ncbi:hypothetical protein LTR17_018348 [Elasticomyces elasticus]|nr:hypothetical protein LTR17_018348 [Elasticomyces elasticus]